MPYANFPPAGYLSSGDRTDAQMQTALEQWRGACQHTTGHGECQLSYVSGNQLGLLPCGGNRMLLHNQGYSIPQTGFVLNTPGSQNLLMYLYLYDSSGTLSNVQLFPISVAQSPWARYRHPESGHEIATYSGAGQEGFALVGLTMTGADGLFKSDRLVSLFNRRMRAFGEHLASTTSFGSTLPYSIMQVFRVGFAGDTIAINASIDAVGGATATLMTAQLYFNSVPTAHHCTSRFGVDEERVMSLVGWYTFPTDSYVQIDLVLWVQSGPVTLSVSTGMVTTGSM